MKRTERILVRVFTTGLWLAMVGIWCRSMGTADLYDVRITDHFGVEVQTNNGSAVFQRVSASFVSNHFLYHDSMPAGPLLGDSTVSFLGFSIRDFKWRFMHEPPVKLYVVPIWFIILGLTFLIIAAFKLGRRQTPARADAIG